MKVRSRRFARFRNTFTNCEMLEEMFNATTVAHFHKPFWPPNETDYVGFLFTGIGLMICAGGGIGGGGLLVPIYIFLMDFSPKSAIVSVENGGKS